MVLELLEFCVYVWVFLLKVVKRAPKFEKSFQK